MSKTTLEVLALTTNEGSLEKLRLLELGLGVYELSLELLVMPKSKERKRIRHIRNTQEPT